MPPTRFGPYTLLRRLAVGGMSEVFLAQRGGQTLVVKQLLPQLAGDPELLELFLHEARVARELVHPGIVRVHAFGEHDGTYYLAMEYVEGLDLDQLLRLFHKQAGRGLPQGLVVRVAIETLRALDFAHRAKDPRGRPLELIHRDISPQNIFLGRDGCVKLGDFGIARTRLRVRRTQAGVLRGKLAYLAPELLQGGAPTRAVDIYSLGVVLFEALTGERPFSGGDARMIKAALTGPTPRLSRLTPGIDPRLEAIVAWAMEKDPARRPATAGELLAALEGLDLGGSREALAALVAETRMARRLGTALRPQRAEPKEAPRPRTETLPGAAPSPKILPHPACAEGEEPTEAIAIAVDPATVRVPVKMPLPPQGESTVRVEVAPRKTARPSLDRRVWLAVTAMVVAGLGFLSS